MIYKYYTYYKKQLLLLSKKSNKLNFFKNSTKNFSIKQKNILQKTQILRYIYVSLYKNIYIGLKNLKEH
jgi:hypothetical protein